MKIDFGVNVNGHIIDSAFTVCFDERFKPLLDAAQEATNVGVKTAGIDVPLCDLGDAIHEVFEAASLEINGKIYDIKPVGNLSGHLMQPYTIHAGKSIPITRGGPATRMVEGELYACETFGTTGKGRVTDQQENLSHYMVKPNPTTPRTPQQRRLLKVLQENFSTLAFCPRFLDRIGEKKFAINLKQLGECGAVQDYPALSDVKGSWVAQFEHSFILLPTHKEVLSRGTDY
jgi:methionyl aminopeptidase